MTEIPHPAHAAHGLGKQLGLFPVGVWLLIVVGGLGVAWWSRNHAATPAPATDPLAGANPSPADLTSAGLDSSGGAGQTGSGDVPLPPPLVIVVKTTSPTPGGVSGGVTTPVTRPAAHPTTTTAAASYDVVRSGDTLTKIAVRHHTTAGHLYQLNHTLLDNTARRHGKANSAHGHWIYPGERIRVR